MGYSPEEGFFGHWDMYAEQLMLYVLSVASPTHPVDSSIYQDFQKPKADYQEIKNIVYTYCGALFTYQYSHAWIDFRNRKDKDGIDWFKNSIKATLANRKYCIEMSQTNCPHFNPEPVGTPQSNPEPVGTPQSNPEPVGTKKTYGKNSWGLTACVSPKGYSGEFGAKPAKSQLKGNDGTISPSGAAGSMVFTPELSMQALEHYYNNFPKLWGKYGFKDAYNLDYGKPWYAKECIGIDKGISMLMIENYLSGLIWRYFMKNEYIQKGLEKLDIMPQKQELEKLVK